MRPRLRRRPRRGRRPRRPRPRGRRCSSRLRLATGRLGSRRHQTVRHSPADVNVRPCDPAGQLPADAAEDVAALQRQHLAQAQTEIGERPDHRLALPRRRGGGEAVHLLPTPAPRRTRRAQSPSRRQERRACRRPRSRSSRTSPSTHRRRLSSSFLLHLQRNGGQCGLPAAGALRQAPGR